jgi:hypothetical protein
MDAASLHDELVAWALSYAAHDIPVFPVRGDKHPLTRWRRGGPGELPSTDPEQIRAWWSRWPTAMIGAPTGEASGFVVLDIDCHGDTDGFATLAARGWTIPADAVEVTTPSGGAHFFFRAEAGISNSAGRIGPGIDVRGEGGFVVLPPSRRTLNGPDYAFAEGQERREPGVLL